MTVMRHNTVFENDSIQSIPVFPKRLTTTTAILTLVLILCLGAEIWGLLAYLYSLQTVHIPVAEQSVILSDLDEKLTLVTYLKASTGDERWNKQHEIFQSGLQLAASQLAKQTRSMKSLDNDFDTVFLSRQELGKTEQKVFDLLRQHKQKTAYEILNSERYLEGKQKFQEKLFKITVALSQLRETQLRHKQREAIIICIVGFLSLCGLFIPWFFLIKTFLKSINRERLRAQRERQLVVELKESQHIAVSNARRAGMAEVATEVLHNVGNVLNSLNVGVQSMQTTIKDSVVSELKRASVLLKENISNLPAFFSNNSKGPKLAAFYLEVGSALESEFEQLGIGALEAIKKIRLINDIISIQQENAKTGVVDEEIDISELLDNVIAMQNNSFSRHDIKVVRNYDKGNFVIAQKAKLMSVLLNLIKNAKEAMEDNVNENRVLTLQVVNSEAITIKISDTGHGVAEENLEKIFSHGFTTKKNGHGFGLHSCANAVIQMGGRLFAESAGPNKGTTFSILLPKKRVLTELDSPPMASLRRSS